MDKICVIGSGMAALGASFQLRSEGVDSILYDKNLHIGGHAASYKSNEGFVFDEGPHVSFTKNKRIQDLFACSVDQKYETIQAHIDNHWRGQWIKHPVICNLHGLPHSLVVDILKDFIQAQHDARTDVRNYEDWLVASYGKTYAETFPMEYTWKYHTTTASNLTTDWVGPRLYQAKLEEVLLGALSPSTPDIHYVSDYRYPSRDGFVSFLRMFVDRSDIHLGHQLVRLDPAKRELHFENGVVATYQNLISSVPLPELLPMIVGAPRDVVEAAAQLACTTVVLVNVGIDRPDISKASWTYFYERDYLFSRVSFPHLMSPHTVPPGTGSIQAEVYFSKKYRPLDRAPETLIDPVIADLRRCGLLREDDKILHREAMCIPYANIIFDLDRPKALQVVHGYLEDVGIAYCGRYGDWGYLWTDQSFISGEQAAQKTLGKLRGNGRKSRTGNSKDT
jgi:protoporphyrinogen oxidase